MRGLTLLLITPVVLALAGPAAVLAQEATPTPGNETLFSGVIPTEVLPTEAGPIYVAKTTFQPGEGEDLLPDNGLNLLVIERGTLTFTMQGPATLLGAKRPSEDDAAPSGSAIDLSAGEGILIPSGTGGTMMNANATDVSVINVGLYPAEGFVPLTPVVGEAPGDEIGWPLLGKGSPQDPPVASNLTIERLAVAPGAEIGPREERGIAVIFVEGGSLQTTVDRGLAEASSGAFLRTGAVGPGAAFVGPGQERRVRAEGSLFVQPGTVIILHNDGDELTSLLVVRLTPIEDGAIATPESGDVPTPAL